ncbi:MAG: CRISPR-associated protein Cas5 [Petrotogales bacterium]
MTKKTIVLEVFQPFAQYRNPFTFYYAQSYPLPPKSTIIGMLQNALGRYYDECFWNLEVSIHGGFESTFWNYQNLIQGDVSVVRYQNKVKLWNQKRPLYKKGFKSQRTPVNQQELFNGHLYIFLRGQKKLIEEIKQSLLNPDKLFYLGRSEDLIFIKNIHDEDNLSFSEKEVKKNIWLTYPTYINLRPKNGANEFPIENEKFPVYSIPVKVLFKNNGKTVSNKAEITKSTEREADFHTVMYTGIDYTVYLKEPVKVENYKIDDTDLVFKIPSDYGWL